MITTDTSYIIDLTNENIFEVFLFLSCKENLYCDNILVKQT